MYNKSTFFVFLFISFCISSVSAQLDTLVNSGDNWKYFTGSDPGATWKNTGFNDISWSIGPSQLGYGEGDEATVLPSGPSNNRNIGFYFRRNFTVSNAALYQAYKFRVKRDDGIVVYVNGNEVWRDNMPSGIPTYATLASSSPADDGQSWITFTLPGNTFITGSNLIAAEVHNVNNTSSDISFELQTLGIRVGTVQLVHGPYLQMATDTSMTIRWRTDSVSNSIVRYGFTPGNLSFSVTFPALVTEHIVRLSGLNPATKYYYSIERTGQIVQRDSVNLFFTAAPPGSTLPTNIWVTGDCGTLQSTQTDVMNEFLNHVGNQYINAWLLLGDNAYNSGTDSEYTSNFFTPYMDERIMKQTPLWPSPGNHDYANSGTNQPLRNLPYYNNFTLPTNGEIGGVPSGTEAFYSYNINNIHFISLDSYGTEVGNKLYDTTGIQATWLKNDLAANTQPWTILYWHHPPFTKGSHNCDTESDLVSVRTKLLRILDRYKVDLVLCGHSHSYERSRLMKGYYQDDSLFSASAHLRDSSSALYNGSVNSCPYIKQTNSPVNEGIVYTVTGSAGKFGGQAAGYPHNAMFYSNTTNGGSTFISVDGNRLDAKFISDAGVIQDQYTIFKNVNRHTSLTINEGRPALLTSSWRGNYNWFPIASTQPAVNVFPIHSGNFRVRDSLNCLSDTFFVNVIDTIIPAITNCPPALIRPNLPGSCGATVTWLPPLATDSHFAGMSPNISPGSFFGFGSTLITYTALDSSANSNTCQFSVSVVDTQAPLISCPASITTNNSPGQCNAVVNFSSAIALDNCAANPGIVQISGAVSGASFPVGVSAVAFRALDNSGNSSTCGFSITVRDNEVPSIACPLSFSVANDSGNCDARVSYVNPIVLDNCTIGTAVLNGGLSSGSIFPLGITTNLFSISDGAGNSASCNFTIRVNDSQPPAISCSPNIIVSADSGNCSAFIRYSFPLSSDNCNSVQVIQNSGLPDSSLFMIGTTMNGFVATDSSGNSASCSFMVTVNDTVLPSWLSCDTSMVQVCESDTVFFQSPVAIDNCSMVNLVQTLGTISGSIYPIGLNDVEFEASDSSGNTIACSFQVLVHALPQISFSVANDSLCLTDSASLLTANPTGGNFSGPGVSGNTFDPALAGIGNHILHYSFSDSFGCTDSAAVIINVQNCIITSSAFVDVSEIRIYPNPAREEIFLLFPKFDPDGKVEVFSLNGTLIIEAQHPQNKLMRIDLGQLSNGLYLLKIESGGQTKFEKFIRL